MLACRGTGLSTLLYLHVGDEPRSSNLSFQLTAYPAAAAAAQGCWVVDLNSGESWSQESAPSVGYGNSAPNDCWGPIMVVTFQTLVGIFLDAIVIGVIFARISHPKRVPCCGAPVLRVVVRTPEECALVCVRCWRCF